MDKKHRNHKMKVVEGKRNRVDFPRKDHREEYATEVAPLWMPQHEEQTRIKQTFLPDVLSDMWAWYWASPPCSCGRLSWGPSQRLLDITRTAKAAERQARGRSDSAYWQRSVILS